MVSSEEVKLSALIIDDEIAGRTMIEYYIQEYADDIFERVVSVSSIKEAVSHLKEFTPTVVFTDYELRNENGLMIQKHLEEDTLLVVVSAHTQYALEAIQTSAFDYLLKPLSESEVLRFKSKLKKRLTKNLLTVELSKFEDTLVIKDSGENIMLPFNDILYLEAAGAYSRIVTESKNFIENLVLVDAAIPVKIHSAHSAIVGVGIDTKSHAIYVRDIDAGMMYPDDLYQRTINMIQRLKARALGVEVTSLNEFITQPFKNELSRQGVLWCEFVELKARGGLASGSKENRIRALVPYYRQGLIYHNPTACHGLEAQLLAFPRSKRWDIMDALAYIIEMLDIGDRFFEPPEDTDDEKMFEELARSDEPVLTDWRII
jgi:DNA-binding LytR/AlgR family response regulator